MSIYPLRLAEDVLAKARQAAAEDNVPLDTLLSSLIADGIRHRQSILSLRERAAQADVVAAMSILDRAPDVPPDEGDELFSSAIHRPI